MRKKNIAFGLGLMMMAISLPACSGSKKNPTATEGPTAVEATDATGKTPGADEDASKNGQDAAGDSTGKTPGSGNDASGNGQDASGDAAGKQDGTGTDASGNGTGASGDEQGVQHIPLTVAEYSLSATKPDSYATMAQCDYFTLELDAETVKQYPALQRALVQAAKDENAHAQKSIAELSTEYQELTADWSEYEGHMSESVKPHVMRADSRIVSVLCNFEDYHGGAHGYYYSYGLNYDVASGRELKLSDVVSKKDKFIELVRDKFEEKYANDSYMLTNAGEYLATLGDEEYASTPWIMDSESITLFFAPYVLGTYADGAQEVSIYFDEAPELFTAQYLDTCAEYVIPLLPARSYEANAGDGKRVAVDVDFDYNDEYGSYAREYVIGNTRIRPEGYSYSSDSYIVVAGGKHYLYTFSSAENDYSMLEVVDVDTKSLDESRTENAGLGGVDYSWNEGDDYDESCLRGPAFTDPSDISLSRRLEVLGTTNGYRSCHVGADGYPAANDELYTILTSFAIRAKKDLKLDVVDASGKKTGTKTVPAGTYLFDMRTDGESFVDLQTIDASALGINDESEWKYFQIADRSTNHIDLTKPIYRVHVDHSDGWPHHVNGVEEDSLFEGIMYAG